MRSLGEGCTREGTDDTTLGTERHRLQRIDDPAVVARIASTLK